MFQHGPPVGECDLAPAKSQSAATNQVGVMSAGKKQKQVCYSYNYTEGDRCEFVPSCKFMHICLYCARDPSMPADKRHKSKFYLRQRRAPAIVAPQYAPPPAPAPTKVLTLANKNEFLIDLIEQELVLKWETKITATIESMFSATNVFQAQS